VLFSLGLAGALALSGYALAKDKAQAEPATHASAYYNFAMGHMYSELAADYGYRSEYVDKAIAHYIAALQADPQATEATEELTNLYIQAGKLREAVNEAKDLLQRNPEDLEPRRILGRIYSRLVGDEQQSRINEQMLHDAIEQYQKVVEKDAADADSWLMLGRLYKVAQNSIESEKAYKKVLALDPDNDYALSGLALVYSDLGDTKSAIEMWRKLAASDPRPEVLRKLAESYEQAHDYHNAAQTLQQAMGQAPQDPEIKKNLAEDLLLAGDTDGSLALYRELAQTDPKDPETALRISEIYREKRDFAKAREAQQKALALAPDNIEVQYNNVTLLDAEGKYPDAIVEMKKILDATAKKSYSVPERANRTRLLATLGDLYGKNGQYAQAIETFQRIMQVDPSASSRVEAQIVDTYRQAKEFTKAEQEADAACKKYPDDRVLRSVRASLLADMGKTEEAAAGTKQLLDGHNDREVYLALAEIYDKGGKFAEMASALDSAEKLSSGDDDKEAVCFMRGAMYEKQQKLELAEAAFRKVLAMNPRNASALNYLGYMLADRNMRLSEARGLISQALDIEPNNGAFLDSLGWVDFRLGRLDEAENYLRQAISRTGNDPTVHDHLGDVLLQEGKLKDAISHWEISLREWDRGARSEFDSAAVSKIQKKLETARVRLAKETVNSPTR
jgi:tetratricopeptide (TPR) repeat protein